MNKFIDYILLIFLMLCVSAATVVVYDLMLISPKIEQTSITVIDVERIFGIYEQKVKKGELNLNEYKNRINIVKELISAYPFIANKNIKLNGMEYPLVFGGNDITDEILDRMEALR